MEHRSIVFSDNMVTGCQADRIQAAMFAEESSKERPWLVEINGTQHDAPSRGAAIAAECRQKMRHGFKKADKAGTQ